jgi:predicted RNA-binding protein with RPS1 domain
MHVNKIILNVHNSNLTFKFLKDLHDESRDKQCMFSTSVKPFDLSEATKLSLVLSASQHINQQQLKDSFMKNFSRYSTSDFDDNDSRFSFSSSSSPVHVSLFFVLKVIVTMLFCFRTATMIVTPSTQHLNTSTKPTMKFTNLWRQVHLAFKSFHLPVVILLP